MWRCDRQHPHQSQLLKTMVLHFAHHHGCTRCWREPSRLSWPHWGAGAEWGSASCFHKCQPKKKGIWQVTLDLQASMWEWCILTSLTFHSKESDGVLFNFKVVHKTAVLVSAWIYSINSSHAYHSSQEGFLSWKMRLLPPNPTLEGSTSVKEGVQKSILALELYNLSLSVGLVSPELFYVGWSNPENIWQSIPRCTDLAPIAGSWRLAFCI